MSVLFNEPISLRPDETAMSMGLVKKKSILSQMLYSLTTPSSRKLYAASNMHSMALCGKFTGETKCRFQIDCSFHMTLKIHIDSVS